jgi:hypothetical protein
MILWAVSLMIVAKQASGVNSLVNRHQMQGLIGCLQGLLCLGLVGLAEGSQGAIAAIALNGVVAT